MEIIGNNANAINKALREEYERTHNQDVFRQYFMSEINAPFEDFDNAFRLVRENYAYCIHTDILVICAETVIWWYASEENEFLDLLNNLYCHMKDEQKAIICYLNGYHIGRQIQFKKVQGPDYLQQQRSWLERSIAFNVPFVNNRVALARISDHELAQQLFRDAIENALITKEPEKENQLPSGDDPNDWLNPKCYIEELITGTALSQEFIYDLKKEAGFI